MHTHAGAHARALQALAQAGVQGVVLVATGNATVHRALEEAAHALAAQGITVVQAPRCTASAVVRSTAAGAAGVDADAVPLLWHTPGQADAGEATAALPVSKARVQLLLQLLGR